MLFPVFTVVQILLHFNFDDLLNYCATCCMLHEMFSYTKFKHQILEKLLGFCLELSYL